MSWRAIPGFSRYLISPSGVIKRNKSSKSIVCGNVDHYGYKRVYLKDDDGEYCSVKVHRLVALTYIGPQPSKERYQVQHKDDDKSNNHWTNLRWGTYKQNKLDAIRNGNTKQGKQAKLKISLANRGERNGQAKMTDKQVLKFRKEYAKGATVRKLCNKLGVAHITMYLAVTGRTWKHL